MWLSSRKIASFEVVVVPGKVVTFATQQTFVTGTSADLLLTRCYGAVGA